MDRFKSKSTNFFTIFFQRFFTLGKMPLVSERLPRRGKKFEVTTALVCVTKFQQKKSKMGYTFEVNIKFYVLSLTSKLNPFLDAIHLMNY